jgi:transposase-like protein
MVDTKSLQVALARKQAEVATLRQQLRMAEQELFTSLPTLLGLESIDALLLALAPYASPYAQQQLASIAAAGRNAQTDEITAMRKQGRITPEARAAIIERLKTSELTAEQIAREFHVSTPSVNLIKRKAGLTKKRLSR